MLRKSYPWRVSAPGEFEGYSIPANSRSRWRQPRILGTDRGLEWHRVVAPGVEVGETTTHGLALSRPRRGFESRWGHQIVLRQKSTPSGDATEPAWNGDRKSTRLNSS